MEKKLFLFISAMIILVSCGTTGKVLTRQSQYPLLYEEKPLVLLILPPINNTTHVEAKEYLYTTVSRPLAESGYYVISPLLAMDILKTESAYDAELFREANLNVFAKYFGADAVVFSEINKWEKQGFGINTNIHYFIKSAKTQEILFDKSCDLYLDLSYNSGSSSLLGSLVDLAVSAVNTATTDQVVAAREANHFIFRDIPRGKYAPEYQQDMEYAADEKEIKANVK